MRGSGMIDTIQLNLDVNREKLGRLAAELSMLGVLKKEGLITEGEFSIIRQQIMDDFSCQKISDRRNQNEKDNADNQGQ